MPYLLVLTTVASKKEARTLSDLILVKKLAACIQIVGPVESVYCWKNKRCRCREFQLWIKTKSAVYSKLEKFIADHHAYEVPEIIALPVTRGFSKYLNWVSTEVC